jgi:hypothetical protein
MVGPLDEGLPAGGTLPGEALEQFLDHLYLPSPPLSTAKARETVDIRRHLLDLWRQFIPPRTDHPDLLSKPIWHRWRWAR